jgi:hypothetical protein
MHQASLGALTPMRIREGAAQPIIIRWYNDDMDMIGH